MQFLKSGWFAAILGAIVFSGALVGFYSASKSKLIPEIKLPPKPVVGAVTNGPVTLQSLATPAHEDPAVRARQELEQQQALEQTRADKEKALNNLAGAGEPGSLAFNNPDVIKLQEELRRQNASISVREQELRNLENELRRQFAEFSALSNALITAKNEISKAWQDQMQALRKEEQVKFADMAKIYTNMPPASAVLVVKSLSPDDVARVLLFMSDKDAAAILDAIAKEGPEGVKRVADITLRYRKVSRNLLEPKLPDLKAPPTPK
jgi:flagellar motility protein MotE (MotC chaperone)